MDANKQWMNRPADERFETLDALRASVQDRRMRSRSVDIDLPRIEASNIEGGLIINSGIQPSKPSHWSFGQLATTVKAPAGYLRTLPAPMVVDLLNHGLRNSERESVKFMTVEPNENAQGVGESSTLQAVTSPTYGRIWDADVTDAVQRIVERTNGKFYNPLDWNGKRSGLYASDHDVFMFMIDGGSILDAGPRAQLNRGFIVWNSETGARTFGLMTFLFNMVCGNHIIWGAQEVNKLVIRHTSGGPYRFDSQAAPTLRAYAEASAQPMIDTIKRAQDYLLPRQSDADKVRIEDILEFTAKSGKFTRGEVSSALDFAKSEEGDCRTLWQLVQGFTAYARGFDYIDARIDLEKRAGNLLRIVNGNN